MKHSVTKPPKRTNRGTKQGPPNKFASQYFFTKRNGQQIRICKKAFTKLLGITEQRVKRVVQRYFQCRSMPKEARGGDRKFEKYKPQKEAVICFVKKFQVVDVHYCRAKVAARQYLPSELSINTLYKMFVKENPNTVIKKSFFRTVFREKFNIGFKRPATDVCSKCIELQEKLKYEKVAGKRVQLMTEKRIHKLKAKAFFQQAQIARRIWYCRRWRIKLRITAGTFIYLSIL